MFVAIDFETYWDAQCSLTKLPTPAYIRHPMFEVHGAAVYQAPSAASVVGRNADGEYGSLEADMRWMDGHELTEFIRRHPWGSTELLAHNTRFDGGVLRIHYDRAPAKTYRDTQAMSYWRWPNHSGSLENLAERIFPMLDMRKNKEVLLETKGMSTAEINAPGNEDKKSRLVEYCLQDLRLTLAAYRLLFTQTPPDEMRVMHMTTRMALVPSLALYPKAARTLRDNARRVVDNLYAAVAARYRDSNAGAYFTGMNATRSTLMSNVSFARALVMLGMTPPASFGQSNPTYVALQRQNPQHALLWKARKEAKSRIDETRASRFLQYAGADERSDARVPMPAPTQYGAAHTMRFGGVDGINMQNLRRDGDLRKCIGPLHEGHKIYNPDWNAIESRILGYVAQEEALTEKYRAGIDVYCDFAATVLGRPVTKDDFPERQFIGKTGILGLGFGMSWKKYLQTVVAAMEKMDGPGIEIDEVLARDTVNTFRSMYYKIPQLWDYCKYLIQVMAEQDPTVRENFGPRGCLLYDGRVPNTIQFPALGARLHYPNLRLEESAGAWDKQYVYDGRPRRGQKANLRRIWGGSMTENIVQWLARMVMTNAMLRVADALPPLTTAMTEHDKLIMVGFPSDRDAAALVEEMEKEPWFMPGLPLKVEVDMKDTLG